MSNFKLNLPTDIPWKRICVTEDMIDRKVGDKKFPLRWQTSMAIFEFKPEEEYQNYDGMTISYLKVACTITGFQPKGDEVGLHHSEARAGVRDAAAGDFLIDPSRWSDTRVIQAYKDAIDEYYGCYGAILEVAVAPQGTEAEIRMIPSSKFPYFMDFEPKKRELYEIVTETGEMMSRSLSGLNVRKGSTTTDSHEVLDVFGGASLQGSFAGTGGGASVQGQWGTKDLNQTEYVDMRTTDSARERRESFSHATQLSQMYHQLNSYHVGTNRASFYILPRPHIVQLTSDNEADDASTFVNGPRLLEGIQEFFLVVIRPEEIENICVEAYLETAHIFQEKIPVYEQASDLENEFQINGSTNEREGETERINSEEEATSFLERIGQGAIGGAIGGALLGPLGAVLGTIGGLFTSSEKRVYLTAHAQRFTPASEDLEFDVSRSESSTCFTTGETKNYVGCRYIPESFDHGQITFLGSVYSTYTKNKTFGIDSLGKDDKSIGKATIKVQVPQRYKETKLINGDKSLFLTGRGVKCCTGREPKTRYLVPSVVWESPFQTERVYDGVIGKEKVVPRVAANAVREKIGCLMFKSVNDPKRKSRGETFFTETDFFTKSIVKVAASSDVKDLLASDVMGLDKGLRELLKSKANGMTRMDLLKISIPEMMTGLQIAHNQAQELRRTLLGLVSAKDAPQETEKDVIKRKTPDMIGLKLNEAAGMLQNLGLRTSDITYVDNEIPKDVVLQQDPCAGSEVVLGSSVDLCLSTGASVRIPDIVSLGLTEGLIMLRKAGLRSEPEITFVHDKDEKQKNIILKVTPKMRTYVTPNSKVRLEVFATGKDDGQKECETIN